MKSCLTFGAFLCFWMSFISISAIPLPTNVDVRFEKKLGQNGIVRSYLVGAVLTQAEEEIILKLAKKRGVKRVGKIVTHYMLPSSAKAIRVEGFAEKKGREVSRKILSVTRKGWTFPNAKPGKNDLVLGDFWAGNVYVRKQFELNVSGKIYLCSSVIGMSFEDAESLLRMFQNKKFMVNPSVRQNSLEQVNWTQPTRFSRKGDIISVGFLAKGEGFFDLQIKEENGILTILQMMQAMP